MFSNYCTVLMNGEMQNAMICDRNMAWRKATGAKHVVRNYETSVNVHSFSKDGEPSRRKPIEYESCTPTWILESIRTEPEDPKTDTEQDPHFFRRLGQTTRLTGVSF